MILLNKRIKILYHRLLSSLLSITLLWQILWIPAAFANEQVNGGAQEEYITPEQAAKELLTNQKSTQLWQQIEQLSQTITGKPEEEAQIRHYFDQKLGKSEDDYVRTIARNYTNTENWSLMTYLKIFYSNEDERPRALRIPLMWGLFDNNLNFLSFAIEPVQKVISETKQLAAKITHFLGDNSIPENDRNIIAVYYLKFAYAPMMGVISLFSDDPKSLDARLAASRSIEISIPKSLYQKNKENYQASGILAKDLNQRISMVPLVLDPRTLLSYLVKTHAEIPSAHFYVSATRLQTLLDLIIRTDYYKMTLDDKSETPISQRCQNVVGVDFPEGIAPRVPQEQDDQGIISSNEITPEVRNQYINALLTDSGLVFNNSTPEGNILYSTYENYHRDYLSANLTYYNGGFSGLLPYEDYFASQHALGLDSFVYGNNQLKKLTEAVDEYGLFLGFLRGIGDTIVLVNGGYRTDKAYREPQINDVEHFFEVLNGKAAQVEYYLKKQVKVEEKDLSAYDRIIEQSQTPELANTAALLAARDAKELYYFLQEGLVQAKELWQRLVNFNIQTIETQTDDGSKMTLNHENFNQYLSEKMIAMVTDDPQLIVPEHIKEKLKRHSFSIDMPHINAPDAWRKWALKIMVNFIDTYVDADINAPRTQDALSLFYQACFNYAYEEKGVPAVCLKNTEKFDNDLSDMNMDRARQVMRNIRELIVNPSDDVEGHPEVLPRLSYDLNLLYSFYPLLQRVWNYAQGYYFLPETQTNEWEYLVSQLPYNGWAVLRLSHLLIEDEINDSEKYNSEAKKHYRKVAKILSIDEILKPFHSTSVLKRNERKSFWEGIAHHTDKENLYLFKAINPDNQRPYYEILRELNDANLFDSNNLNNAKSIVGSNVDRSELDSALKKVLTDDNSREIQYLNRMFLNARNTEQVIAMAKDYFNQFPYTPEEQTTIDLYGEQGYDASLEVPSRFLQYESEIKKPLYQHALKEASYLKLKELPSVMNNLCQYIPFHKKGLDKEDYQKAPSNHSNALVTYLNAEDKLKSPYEVPREDYNDLFEITSASQVEIKHTFEVDIPKWAQKFANRLLQSDEDVMALIWALGSAACYMISIGITGGATLTALPQIAVGTIGKLLPQILASSKMIFGIAALATEFISGFHFERAAIIDAKTRTASRQEFQQFGTMAEDAQASLGYNYVWLFLEFAFFSQLLGETIKGVKLFTRTLYATQKKGYKLLSNIERLEKFRGLVRELSSSGARSILNMNRHMFKRFGDNWLKSGFNAIRFDFLRGFKGAVTPAKTNAHFARVVAHYFNESPDELASFLGRFTSARHQKIKQNIQKLISAGKLNSSRLKKLSEMDEIYTTAKKLSQGARNLHVSDGIEQYLLENVEDFCRVSMKMSWTQWFPGIEVPYHWLVTGMPAGNKRLPVLRGLVNTLPGLATANDRILIQRIVSARNILLVDHQIKTAAKTLGITVDSLTKYQLKRTFDGTIESVLMHSEVQNDVEYYRHLSGLFENLQDQQAEAVVRYFKRRPNNPISKLSPQDFKELLKKGDPKAIVAFNNTPADKLFEMQVSKETAYEVIKKLSEEQTSLSNFGGLLNALKIYHIREFIPELKYTI